MSAHYDVLLTFSGSCLIFNSSQDGGRALEREGTTTPQHLEVRGSSRSDRQTVERVKLQSGEGCTNSPQYKCMHL